jgi:predicted nucleic acid-binding Zn ribbon protein
MKCGTTIPTGQVFCDPCLEDMEKHPVNPGTPIQLPVKQERVVAKVSHKKLRKPEDMIATLRALVFWLILVIVALITALSITVALLVNATENQPAQTQIESHCYL